MFMYADNNCIAATNKILVAAMYWYICIAYSYFTKSEAWDST